MGITRRGRYDLDRLWRKVEESHLLGMNGPEDLTRIASVIMDGLGVATADEAWAVLVGDFRAGRRGTRRSGERAGTTIRMGAYLGHVGRLSDERARLELCIEAIRFGPRDPALHVRLLGLAYAHDLHIGATEPSRLEAELALIDRVRETVAPDSPEWRQLRTIRGGVRLHLGVLGGEDDFDAAVEELADFAGADEIDAEARAAQRGALAILRTHQAVRTADEASLAIQADELAAVLDALSPENRSRLRFEAAREHALTSARLIRDRKGLPVAPDVRPWLPIGEVLRQVRLLPLDARPVALCETGMARMHRAMAEEDTDVALEAVSLVEDGLALLGPDALGWVTYTFQLGWGLRWIAREGRADRYAASLLDRSVHWLSRAIEAVGGPEDPHWADISMETAWAMRLRAMCEPAVSNRAGLDAARRTGADALYAAVRTVFLQSGTDHAAWSAYSFGNHALGVARWCLADAVPADAVRTLDAGRGLALHAATVRTTVPEMLRAAGRPDLAAEWHEAEAHAGAPASAPGAGLPTGPLGTGPSSRLRRKVLAALENLPDWERLWDVPTPDNVGAALRGMGRTALVYLLPGVDDEAGAAVIVAPGGGVTSLRLPGLGVDVVEAAERRVGGGRSRDVRDVLAQAARDMGGPSVEEGVGGALARLCGWAGRVVMGPLLQAVGAAEGRVPSLVLVPMGALGAVPWHAARLPSGRYACQEAEISYMPSARLLCEVAGRRPTGVRRAVVVGDPTGDLEHAGAEARAIHRTFYPEGTLLGTATATPATVAGRVARQGGGVLHLACHGTVEAGRRHSSYLKLSGGRLPAEELTEGASRLRDLELVVLAACRTNVSGHGYDEAYSLSTAFLVAGARSVVGSLWPVPDDATSLLMYMTHHYLNREGLPPGSALRRAQLWMLYPGRQAPPGMPKEMVARVGRIKADDLIGWAGFTHLGW
ncbi:CHAT domain-containing protein [Streptomyces zhihengii]|uniref:CHAT domain-containing protein n=1 Tax=Streptomyces zhihengii TaxID=1818004 RepID=UPI003454062F